MKDIIVAFDCDGTLINNGGKLRAEGEINKPMVELLKLLKITLLNVYIIIWSGGGKEYAESVARRCGIEEYVSGCHSKQGYDSQMFGKVDIAFDDVEAFKMAATNLIVKTNL